MKAVMTDSLDYRQDPSQASLAALLQETARIRIWDEGICGNEPLGELLLELTEPEEIAKLCKRLIIVDGPAGHCLCYGDVALEMLSGNNRRLALLGLHHGALLRWNAWVEDAALADGLALLELLAEHGVTEPLARYVDEQAEEAETLDAWNRWIEARPPCLKQLLEEDWMSALEDNRRDIILRALAANYTDANAAIHALLHWYGSNTGCWSGYPVYEDLAAIILSWYPPTLLIPAMESAALTDTQLEGAARLCAGDIFAGSAPGVECAKQSFPAMQYFEPSGQMVFMPPRKQGAASIPAGLRRRLLDFCLQSADADKRKRALAAFTS